MVCWYPNIRSVVISLSTFWSDLVNVWRTFVIKDGAGGWTSHRAALHEWKKEQWNQTISWQNNWFLTFLFEQFILLRKIGIYLFLSLSVFDLIGNNYFQTILDKNDCCEKYFSSFQNSTQSRGVCLDNSQLYNSLKYYAKIFLWKIWQWT